MVFLTIKIFTSTILDGGTLLKVEHPRDYFMENLEAYVMMAKNVFRDYYLQLKSISAAVRRIGGAGDISGCTVVVDDNLKIILDPTDMRPVLYRAVTGDLIYYESFRASGFLDDKYVLQDRQLVAALTLKSVTWDVPPHLSRKSIRDMNHVSEALQSIISQDVVRRWDDRILDMDATLETIMMKADKEEEEE